MDISESEASPGLQTNLEPDTNLDSLPIELLNIIGVNLDLENNLDLATISKKVVSLFGVEKIKRWVRALQGPNRVSWVEAITNFDIHVIKYYIRKHFKIDWDAIESAMEIGDPYIFKLIFQYYIGNLYYIYKYNYHGRPPDYNFEYTHIYRMAEENNKLEIIKYLEHEGAKFIIFHCLIEGGLHEAKDMLIDLKDIYHKNVPNEILHEVYKYLTQNENIYIFDKNLTDISRILLEVGATDIDTLLFLAILGLDVELVSSLLSKYKIDIKTLNTGLTILVKLDIYEELEFILGEVKVLELLVQYGANDKNSILAALESINEKYANISQSISRLENLIISYLKSGIITEEDVLRLASVNLKIWASYIPEIV